jgi:hypothetical protein
MTKCREWLSESVREESGKIRAAGGRQSCELYSLRSDAGHLFSEYSVTGVHRSLSRSRRRLCNHSSVGEYAQLHRSCAKSDTVSRSACYSSCQLFQPGTALTELRIRAILRITPRKRASIPRCTSSELLERSRLPRNKYCSFSSCLAQASCTLPRTYFRAQRFGLDPDHPGCLIPLKCHRLTIG